MLADAVRSEGYRFLKNRMVVFWSVAFVPLAAILIGALVAVLTKANEARLTEADARFSVPGGALDLGDRLLSDAGDLANPAVLLFVLIAAATLFAGDYRWETWRLISARNSRANLLAGKIGVLKLAALAAMALLLVSGQVVALTQAAVFARPVTVSMSGTEAGHFGLLALLAYVRILQFTLVGLLAAVFTRSLLAALFAPLVLGVGQFVIPQMLGGLGFAPDSWLVQLMSPGLAFDSLKALVTGGGGPAMREMAPDLWLRSLASVILWTLGPTAAAFAWFQRQDLSKE